MLPKHILSTLAVAALVATPVERAAADTHGLIGAIIGGAIVGSAINNSNKRTTTTRVVTSRSSGTSSKNSAARARNREMQTALNYFGFNAGSPDGVIGRNTRAAVSGMQAFLAFPVTGNLTQFERDILIGAYQRGIAGSYETLQMVSTSPDGSKALLQAQKDMLTGTTTARRTTGYAGLPIEVSEAVDEIANSSDPTPEQLLQRSGFIQLADLNKDGKNDYIIDTSYSGSGFWCSTVQCKTIVFASTSDGYRRNDLLAFDPIPATFNCVGGSCVVNEAAPDTGLASSSPPQQETPPPAPETGGTLLASETAETGGALPIFGAPAAKATLSSHCTKVSIVTNSNGGLTTVSTMQDPRRVMSEQLCAARAIAITDGEQIALSIPGVTLAQVDAQCTAYGDALKEQVAGLSLKSKADVIGAMGNFVLNSGMDPAQLETTAKICLSSGYRTDNMGVAIGSGLLLIVLGQPAYAELMGHHLSQGFGATERIDLSLPWYGDALAAIEAGNGAVFGPNQPERGMLLQAAVTMMRGDGASETSAPSASGGGAKIPLPTFGAASQ